MALRCRFYKHKYPEVEDIVVANVRSIAEMGAYVHLLEYDRKEGLILLSELSRRRIRSINKLIRVGRSECVVVIRVDREQGYIDLSKRRVSPEEIKKCEEKFAKGKAVNSILTHMASLLKFETSEELEDLYEKTAWHFDDKFGKAGASYEAFKHAVINPDILDELEIDEEMKALLLANIRQRLTPQPIKLRSDVDVACYAYEGVDAVKKALLAGLEFNSEEFPLKINLIAPPTYVITMTTLDRILGLEHLQKVIDSIKSTIESSNGRFTIRMAAKVVSDTEEAMLAEQLQKLELANQEISGDEDSDQEEDQEDTEAKTNGGESEEKDEV